MYKNVKKGVIYDMYCTIHCIIALLCYHRHTLKNVNIMKKKIISTPQRYVYNSIDKVNIS